VAAPKGKFENNQMSGADISDLCAAPLHIYTHTHARIHSHTQL